MFDKGKSGITWDYLKERHPEILSELKTLREWDTVKSIVPESEKLDDYSLLALQALASLIREFHIERNILGERIEILNGKLEDLRTEVRESNSSLEKRIKALEDAIRDIQRKMLFVEGVSNLIPRINELEEKMEANQAELLARLEKRYAQLIEERVDEMINQRLQEFERSILGISGDLAKTLREMQEKHETLVIENYRLKKEVEPLKAALRARESEIAELRKKLARCNELNKKIDELQRRVKEYEERVGTLSPIEKELLEITGAPTPEGAIALVKRMKSEYVPRSKLTPLLAEVKRLKSRIEELEDENRSLREKNEKLGQALKMLLERGEEEGE
ncbi:hypothetical protein A3L09_04550 [Thermococcus profundus]|uniref:Uncharacterized protein n=1 Tax=Thermococcus profundus TaxID=49899 RepID=A0A2Z2MKT6_THEPR|nr:hypothetical protein [Thermococcus profundus]ASJ02578.1 hypothetical protein A3L09_04550 [Thermococcus profundus]